MPAATAALPAAQPGPAWPTHHTGGLKPSDTAAHAVIRLANIPLSADPVTAKDHPEPHSQTDEDRTRVPFFSARCGHTSAARHHRMCRRPGRRVRALPRSVRRPDGGLRHRTDHGRRGNVTLHPWGRSPAPAFLLRIPTLPERVPP